MAAKPYREGSTWSVRQRVNGKRIYLSGFATAREAEIAAAQTVADGQGREKGKGPYKTSLATALQIYGLERLPFLRGAPQEVRRINRYLRDAGLATLVATPLHDANQRPGKTVYFEVSLEPPLPNRKIPRGLGTHRAQQAEKTARSDAVRRRLANIPVADIARHDLQNLVSTQRQDNVSASTIANERALLRVLFNYVQTVWNWPAPNGNPATRLRMPVVDNARDRVMSPEEQAQLDSALAECTNQLVAPTLTLLRETAMRASEPIAHARWRDVDFTRRVIRLPSGKTGRRDVPLSIAALEALHELQRLSPGGPDELVVRITYESLKAAWNRSLERAGIEDLHIHDLRHTAATRLALKTGNVFLVQALTGHKTLSQLKRYVNVKAEDVVAALDAPAPESKTRSSNAMHAKSQLASAEQIESAGNVVRVNFRRNAA